MIWIILIWLTSGTFAFVTALLAVNRVLPWLSAISMRYLLAFFLGSAVYDGISIFVSVFALRTGLLDTAPSFSAILLTIGHMTMITPAILFRLYLLGALDRPTIAQIVTEEKS